MRVPAMPNAHSHAFQWWLRAAAERPAPDLQATGDFWSWRTEMFRLATELDPDRLREVATAVYAEMARSGYGAVGEFHYVHHQDGGRPYEDPNIMATTLAAAAVEAGLRMVLLPAAYHRNGWDGQDRPVTAGQLRFRDADVHTFLARVDQLRDWARTQPNVDVGIAAHSVRAVPASWLEAVSDYAEAHGLVRHVHACEQRREIEECRAEHGCSPIELLGRTGFLGPTATVVHGIHVTAADVELMARADTIVVSCPTTEGNLGDGHFPAIRYRDAGVRMAIGSDSQVRVDPFEEVRELETGARRLAESRHALLAAYGDLWAEVARNGRASLGLGDGFNGAGTLLIDTLHPQLRGIEASALGPALATCASAEVVSELVP